MKDNATSDRHQNNNLKAITAFAKFLGSETTFYQISTKDQVTEFLDTKIRSDSDDPERRWSWRLNTLGPEHSLFD